MSVILNSHVSKKQNITRQQGFTLVELVIVIVLLGVLSVGISSFISMGTQIFVDVKSRTELTSTARFVVERINRELRGALPNSVRVSFNIVDNRQCIEFIPIITAANYLDIPAGTAEVSVKTIKTIAFDKDALLGLSAYTVVVYPLNVDDVYLSTSQKKFTLFNPTIIENGPQWDLTYSNSVLFGEDSPTSRLFFVDKATSYCVKDAQIRRFVEHNPNNASPFLGISDSDGVLMADYVFTLDDLGNDDFPFTLSEPTQFRSSTVLMKLQLKKFDELIVFNNEIHIPNAP